MKKSLFAVALISICASGNPFIQAAEQANEAERATQLCEEELAAGVATASTWQPQSRFDTFSFDKGPAQFRVTVQSAFNETTGKYEASDRTIVMKLFGFERTYTDVKGINDVNLRGVCVGYGAEVQNFMKTRRGSK